MNNAAGMATNAGINYQQRVSASFLMLMTINSDISIFINHYLFKNKTIESLQLEGIDKIDDLIIILNDNQKLFFQIKRSINLSDSKSSDFYKTIEQFILQYMLNQNNESFFLITTSYSSSKITRDTKKIMDTIRLNNCIPSLNSLNKSEQEALTKYDKVVKNIFKKYNKKDIEDNEFLDFTKKIFILNFDIEENSTMEKAIFSLMANQIIINPTIFWDILISHCLKYASQRMTISYLNSKEIYKDYLTVIKENHNIEILNNFLIPEFKHLNIASGKEVLLCKPSDFLPKVDDNGKAIDFYIIELFRFDENGNKKVKFTNTHCILSDNISSLEIVYRASTNKEVEIFIEKNQIQFKDKLIVILPAHNIDYIEISPYTKAYSEKLISKLKNHKEYLKCIKCGKPISENNSTIIEIDQQEYDNNIGLIHNSCHQPTLRVLGRIESNLFQDYSLLKNFDWKQWIKKIIKAQGLFGTEMINREKSIKTILWNSEVEYNTTFDYCIKEHLQDNTYQYVLRRGKVERFNKQKAENGVLELNKMLDEKKKSKDYICVSNKEKIFSTYNMLKNRIDIDDKLIEVIKYSIEKITPQIIDEFSTIENYYTPLFYIQIGENQELFKLGDRVVLLNDPFLFKDYLNNWGNNLEIFLSDYELIIIENDEYFDNFMHKIYRKNLKAVINPQFNLDGNFIQGYLIEEFKEKEILNRL